jgi:hypothetical protein
VDTQTLRARSGYKSDADVRKAAAFQAGVRFDVQKATLDQDHPVRFASNVTGDAPMPLIAFFAVRLGFARRLRPGSFRFRQNLLRRG